MTESIHQIVYCLHIWQIIRDDGETQSSLDYKILKSNLQHAAATVTSYINNRNQRADAQRSTHSRIPHH